jgi:hypothetical protein
MKIVRVGLGHHVHHSAGGIGVLSRKSLRCTKRPAPVALSARVVPAVHQVRMIFFQPPPREFRKLAVQALVDPDRSATGPRKTNLPVSCLTCRLRP